MMIAVRMPASGEASAANVQLQATLQHIAMRLYSKAHLEVPASATDFGGGLYNILV
jgi:hypothetical protein